jgi:hypothetical protein
MRDPFSAGAWAYFNPGTVTKFLPAMFQAQGRVHFCGEQTATAARGMEGALESGARAAGEVMRALLGGSSPVTPACHAWACHAWACHAWFVGSASPASNGANSQNFCR